jgi:hypothetical protein
MPSVRNLSATAWCLSCWWLSDLGPLPDLLPDQQLGSVVPHPGPGKAACVLLRRGRFHLVRFPTCPLSQEREFRSYLTSIPLTPTRSGLRFQHVDRPPGTGALQTRWCHVASARACNNQRVVAVPPDGAAAISTSRLLEQRPLLGMIRSRTTQSIHIKGNPFFQRSWTYRLRNYPWYGEAECLGNNNSWSKGQGSMPSFWFVCLPIQHARGPAARATRNVRSDGGLLQSASWDG